MFTPASVLPKKTKPVQKEKINPQQLVHSVGLPPTFLQDHPSQKTSLFYFDSKRDVALSNNINNFEGLTKATGETFLFMVTLHEVQKYSDWTMVLTDQAFYKFDVDSSLSAPRKRKALLDFHSVEADSSNPLLFTTRLYKASVKNNMKSSLYKLMGNLGSRIDSEAFLQVRQYVCQSELQRDQVVWLFNRAIRNIWQRTLESHVIPEPEFYQTHQFVIKTNRKGAHQERLLVLSNKWIYNLQVSHAPTTIHSIKWAISIDCISSVALEEDQGAIFFFDKTKLQKMISTYGEDEDRLGVNSKLVSDYEFSFRDDFSRGQFVAILQYIYGQLTGDESKLLIVDTSDDIPPPPPAEETENETKAQTTVSPKQRGNNETIVFETYSGDDKPLICEPLDKLVKGSKKSHVRTFALYPNLTIKWGDSDKKFKYTGKILGLLPEPEILNELPPEKKPCFFALRTSEKPLYLLAKSAIDKATWLNVVSSLIEPNEKSQLPSFTKNVLNASVPLIKGPMTKYTKGGRDKHTKYFCLYMNGLIKWGNSDGEYKYSAQVLEVDQDIGQFQGKIAHEDSVRFVRILTSQKPLELLCPNQNSADRWVKIITNLLHPELADQIILNSSDEEYDD